MKYFHLVWAALFRRKTRTIFTLLSVLAAFLLFGMLDAVRSAFNAPPSAAGVSRLVVSSRSHRFTRAASKARKISCALPRSHSQPS